MTPTHERTIEVEAIQFTGDNGFIIQDAMAPYISFVFATGGRPTFLQVFTPTYIMEANVGDWVVRGEFGITVIPDEKFKSQGYVAKPSDFADAPTPMAPIETTQAIIDAIETVPTPEEAPGMTDLMVPPEVIDEVVPDLEPFPETPAVDAEDAPVEVALPEPEVTQEVTDVVEAPVVEAEPVPAAEPDPEPAAVEGPAHEAEPVQAEPELVAAEEVLVEPVPVADPAPEPVPADGAVAPADDLDFLDDLIASDPKPAPVKDGW
jgi:hypothetical protein